MDSYGQKRRELFRQERNCDDYSKNTESVNVRGEGGGGTFFGGACGSANVWILQFIFF